MCSRSLSATRSSCDPTALFLAFSVFSGLLWYGRRSPGLTRSLRLTSLCALLVVLPLIPWTIRNWRTFHVFQPLAPRRVNNPGEFVAYGFYNWLRTWTVEFVSTCNVYWQAGENSHQYRQPPLPGLLLA